MHNFKTCTLTVPSIKRVAPIHTVLLACLFSLLYLFGTTSPAHAEAPTTFKVPYEVKHSDMLMLDLNGDGKLEIIVAGMDGHLMVVNGLSYDVIFNKNLADYLQGYSSTRMQASLAAADLDGNGTTEIVIATGGADPVDGTGPGAIIVLNYVGGSQFFRVMQGWPVFARDELGNGSRPDSHPDGFYSTPSLGDIDGDGDLEIVIGGMDRRIHAFHHNGSYVLGWPLDNQRSMWRESRSTAALADLNNDGILDVLIGSNNYGIPGCANPYHFYGFKGDLSLLPGFPFSTTQNIESSPAIGDINGDGSPDIVFGTGDFNENCGQQSDGKKVYALDSSGNLIPGWPVTTNANMVNSPALGDLDNDGKPEVVIHTDTTLYAWHGDGKLVQGFPVQGEYQLRHSSPVLADVDGDSQVEIVLSAGQIYNADGQLQEKRNKLQSKVIVIDQDGDGLLETIGFNHYNYDKGWHLQGYVFQETGPATGAQPWPMFHRSFDRTGVLPRLFVLKGRIVDEANQGVAGVEVTLNSGQVAVTDSNGDYLFGSLPAGSYTATPAFQDNIFEPSEQTTTLTSNKTLPPMMMTAAAYDVTGKVMHANNSPLEGVTMQLSSGAQATTGADGRFIFSDQNPGSYTLTPVAPDFTYLPAERTLLSEDKLQHYFHALPKAVEGTLTPNSATQVEFMDTQGLPTRITFPQGLGEQMAKVTPILASDPSGYLFAGHAFEIATAGSTVSAQADIVGENGEPLAIEIAIHYSASDLQSVLAAEELTLLWLSPDGWTTPEASCLANAVAENNLATQVMTVPVCQWGTYGLFAPISRLYMPNLGSEG